MLRTKALLGILPKFQHPLPLTQRESQKLLNVLKTTFRKNLDERPDSLSPEPPSQRQPAHQPTDRHLDAILSNPLFSHARQPNRRPQQDHMAVFDHAVSRGLMSLTAATGCLRALRKQILQAGEGSAKEAMAASGAGSRVVQWLRSSGQEQTFQFVSSPGLMREIASFLLAEQREEVVWTWLDLLMSGHGPENRHRLAGLMLLELVRGKCQVSYDYSLDAALATVIRVDESFSDHPGFHSAFIRPWHSVSRGLTLNQLPRRAPSEKLFDSFVGTSHHLDRWGYLPVVLPHLDLHHPTRPTPDRALELLHDATSWDRFWRKSLRHGWLRAQLIALGADLVSHLQRFGETAEARSVADLLRRRLVLEDESLGHVRSGGFFPNETMPG